MRGLVLRIRGPKEACLSHRLSLLDVFCQIDVVDEIQSEDTLVVELFDNIHTIAALFEIIKLNVSEHKGKRMFFPQLCADVFSCLPDRFIEDICSNDYLMDSFFSIPTNGMDSKWAVARCLDAIALSSYLSSLRYLLDIPVYSDVCWWGDSKSFTESILCRLEDAESSFNIKELLLSIIQRATVFNEKDSLPSSYWLLKELTTDASIAHLFAMLQAQLNLLVAEYQAQLDASQSTDYVGYLARQVQSSAEIANNIFLVLSRLFQRHNQGYTTGRGGYNACFNATPVAFNDLVRMGGVRSAEWMQRVVRQCRAHLCAVFNTVQRVVILHVQTTQRQKTAANPSGKAGVAANPSSKTIAANPSGKAGVAANPSSKTIAANPFGKAGVAANPSSKTIAANPSGKAGVATNPSSKTIAANPFGKTATAYSTTIVSSAGKTGNSETWERRIPSSVLRMAPKPVIGFCEFFYHFTRYENSPESLLHLLKHHYIDSVLWIMETFPSVTLIHVNVVDILITLLYSRSTRVWRALFKQTWLLEIIYQAVTTPALSPLKAQLMIFLQALATCLQRSAVGAHRASMPLRPRPSHSLAVAPVVDASSAEEASEESGGSVPEPCLTRAESLLQILESCDYFMKIVSVVDVFHIYEPLVMLSNERKPTFVSTNGIGEQSLGYAPTAFRIPT
ncbi:hypothetical protein BLSTO_00319 [Blastocystis sp. subtype 1]